MCRYLEPFIPYYVNDEDEKKSSKHVGVYVGYSSSENSVVVVFRGSIYLVNFIQVLLSPQSVPRVSLCDAAPYNVAGHGILQSRR